MPFNGSEGSQITLSRAIELTTNYRDANQGKILSIFLGTNILKKLLDQPESQGIRFYFGLDGEATRLVAVSADHNEDDLFTDGYLIADEGSSGPPHSGMANVLNS
ncbi:hypothetical protein Q5H92_24505 [Hymenobacter sp. M29]|uniref:Uncharacterized protein n=1 Tax=Hymenobacter mellowenesis TaxID=3063995 RepID=A0ABT9AKW6_9BACT|nr:hypothetical protein [Hymenobacter sp. M29]MDO7849547.1 hypothetical protein [Hymenobacter sp. M29]